MMTLVLIVDIFHLTLSAINSNGPLLCIHIDTHGGGLRKSSWNNKLQNNNIILLNLIKARSKMSKLVSYISCFHFVFIYFFIFKKKL